MFHKLKSVVVFSKIITDVQVFSSGLKLFVYPMLWARVFDISEFSTSNSVHINNCKNFKEQKLQVL